VKQEKTETMDLLTECLLPMQQRQIIDRAASRIRKENRAAFRTFVIDVLRARRDPPDNTDVRHACGAAYLKYGRHI
jgi:hypothetical protein